MPSSRPAPDPGQPPVKVVRSPRRRKTVTAYWQGETVVVQLPARMSRREEARWVAAMVQRLQARRHGPVPPSDERLLRRARVLAARYLDGRVSPRSVRWVGNLRTRYGSCTPEDGTIRISGRVASYPTWVQDYVLVHELAHLLVPDHSPGFWQLVNSYPLAERARGFLIAKGMEEGP